MSADRDAVRARLLADAGWSDAEIAPLAGDASFRRYFRLRRGQETAVLMDAPPPQENVRPFLSVAERLVGYGYSAPRVLARDVAQGFLLLEDLGDDSFNRVLRSGGDEGSLYAAAIDVLVDLRRRPQAPGLPPFDEARILREVGLVLDWFWPAQSGRPADPAMNEEYRSLWRSVVPAMRGDQDTMVLFDYHVDNLMWLPDRSGVRRVGLLDFQDAVWGPAAYDVVSLLEDARRDVPDAIVGAMLERYGRAVDDPAAFAAAYAAVGAQRNARIVGVFARLWLRDRKPQYLALLPRVWRLLEHDLAHPALATLRAWFDRHVPSSARHQAPTPDRFRLPS